MRHKCKVRQDNPRRRCDYDGVDWYVVWWIGDERHENWYCRRHAPDGSELTSDLGARLYFAIKNLR